MHIVFVTSNYPYESRPYRGTFVQQLVRAIARTGVKCSVICPLSVLERRFGKLGPKISRDMKIKDNPIMVWSPRYLSASARDFLLLNTNSISQLNYNKAVKKTLAKIRPTPDILYGHFLYPSGALAVRLAAKMRIPSIVAVGEDTFLRYFRSVSPAKCRQHFSKVSGIVAVSQRNKWNCKENLGTPEEKILVYPNGVDLSLFYPRDRVAMRDRFGLPTNKFVIAFAGHFNERKGPHRLLSAVSGMENIGLVFIGAGGIPIKSKNILFKGVIDHSRMPEILSAADIFVLPTLSEGSCNASIEALACGLPVVTSNAGFPDDNVVIHVDPRNINEIRKAILRLRKDKVLRYRMSQNGLAKVKQYDINLRAEKIVEWIKDISINHGSAKSILV